MHSRLLRTGLTEFVESAASHLQAEIDIGAEVPFEVGSRAGRGGGAALYCYRALTGVFIAERDVELERLPGHAEAVSLLEGFDGLERYLASVGVDAGRTSGHSRARAAIMAFLGEVFQEQTDFEIHPERLQAAFARLERSALASASGATLVATLHGVTITSPQISLTNGLTIAHPDALEGMPDGAGSPGEGSPGEGHLLVLLTVSEDEGATEGEARRAVAQGREVLAELLRALRLFGDGRVTLGALAWVRVGGGPWGPMALGTGGAPHGMLVVTAEQEDELRAFCNLVSRRAPHGNELAWALGRFELGCERERSEEGLTDHLLALRALLEPEGPSSGLLAGRLAALCATPEQRVALTERILAAVALERALITGGRVKRAGVRALSREVADHLRALLRDVICGHLAPDLPALADEILSAPEDEPEDTRSVPEPALF